MPYVLGELIVTLCTIVAIAVLWIDSASIPQNSGEYPRGLLGLAFVLSVSFLLVCVRTIMKQGLQKNPEQPVPGAALQNFVICCITGAYLFLLEPVGYLIMTPIFILACLLYLGMRSLPVLVGLPVFLTGFTYYLFGNILYIFLPQGILY